MNVPGRMQSAFESTRYRRVGTRILLAAAMAASCPAVSHAASLVPVGEPAPSFALPTLDGETIQSRDLTGRIVLLLFGELYNPNSIAACKELTGVLNRPALADLDASAFMIATQKGPPADLKAAATEKGIRLPILRDVRREAFAVYQVIVLPSLVVLDARGVTVLACAGYPLGFEDLVEDAILLASGKLSEAQFARQRTPEPPATAPESEVRAMRLAALGEQLARRGSELAIGNFQEAIRLDPDCVPARIGLGTAVLNRGDVGEAERQFLHVLSRDPESVEAALGLIRVQIIRGGAELKQAEERLRELLRKRSNDPQVVYLLGLVAEKTGDAGTALSHYKRAAELLLYGPTARRDVP